MLYFTNRYMLYYNYGWIKCQLSSILLTRIWKGLHLLKQKKNTLGNEEKYNIKYLPSKPYSLLNPPLHPSSPISPPRKRVFWLSHLSPLPFSFLGRGNRQWTCSFYGKNISQTKWFKTIYISLPSTGGVVNWSASAADDWRWAVLRSIIININMFTICIITIF